MKKYIFLLVAIFLAIFTFEIFMRLRYYEQLKTRQTATNRIPDSLLVYTRKAYTVDTIITPGVNRIYRTNNKGFLGQDFQTDKKDPVFRIAVVGNSNTAATQKNDSDNFCSLLQRNCQSDGLSVEVYNFGKEGGEKDIQNLNGIESEVISYNPDLILLELTFPIYYKRYVFEEYRNYVLEYDPHIPESRQECIQIVDDLYNSKILTSIYDVSFIVRAYCKKYIERHSMWDVRALNERNSNFEKHLYSYIRKDAKAYVPIYTVSWGYYYERLKEINQKLSPGSKIVFFTYGQYSNDVRKLLNDCGIGYLELRIYQYTNLPIFSKLEGHFNELAHSLLAERLYGQLNRKGYINKCNYYGK